MSLLNKTKMEDKVALLAEGVGRNCRWVDMVHNNRMSPSSRRAWVEMALSVPSAVTLRSPSSRRAWVEICLGYQSHLLQRSPSSRRAWVEMLPVRSVTAIPVVALLAEGVGRNPAYRATSIAARVALLAEGVGRNA